MITVRDFLTGLISCLVICAVPLGVVVAEPAAVPGEEILPRGVLAIRGDRDWGEYLAGECIVCHQRDGSDDGIPGIANLPEKNLVIALHAYRQGLRPNPVMQLVASRLSDEEIAALAAYFATID